MSKILKIDQFDVANGPGVRTSVWFSGCHFKCEGCHNSQAWDFSKGVPVDYIHAHKLRDYLSHVAVKSRLSVLGGEPLAPENIFGVNFILLYLKKHLPDLNVWLWTGYTYENLTPQQRKLVDEYVDVLVDGTFEIGKKDLSLKWCGSTNQRVIDIKKNTVMSDQ